MLKLGLIIITISLVFNSWNHTMAAASQNSTSSGYQTRLVLCATALLQGAQKYLLQVLSENFEHKTYSVEFDYTSKAKLQFLKQIDDGQGTTARVYFVRFQQPPPFPNFHGRLVAKVPHAFGGGALSIGINFINELFSEENDQYHLLYDSIDVLKNDPDFPLDFGWGQGSGRLPIARILGTGRLGNGLPVLIKEFVPHMPVQQIKEKYGHGLSPAMIQSLKNVYFFAKVLRRQIRGRDGRLFVLDVYPKNLLWVEDPQGMADLGLSAPAFILPEANIQRTLFPQRELSFDEFAAQYRDFLAMY